MRLAVCQSVDSAYEASAGDAVIKLERQSFLCLSLSLNLLSYISNIAVFVIIMNFSYGVGDYIAMC